MATKKQLQERWQTGTGSETKAALFKALIGNPSREELQRILSTLPLRDEVPSGLDLRGLDEVPFFNKLDLSAASLDYTSMLGPVIGCNLTRASMVAFDARGLHLQSDFTEAGLERAKLNDSRLMGANLTGANLTRAKLVSASMRDVNFQRAKLCLADLRFGLLASADLRGTDLTDASLVETSLGGVNWDDHTILRGADLTGASMSDDFLAFAQRAGAKTGAPQGAYELAEFDATAKALRARNQDGHLDQILGRLDSLREQLAANPQFNWGTVIASEFPPEIFQEVADALQESTAALGDHV